MKFQGAVIREQGITFAIAVVKKEVLDNKNQADKTIVAFQPIFGNIPIVLMAQNYRGVPTYYGRKDKGYRRFYGASSIERCTMERIYGQLKQQT